MAAGQARGTEARAYRFGIRQLEWVVSHGDALPHHDPGQLPRRWTMVSVLLGLALLAGCGVYGLLQPAPDWRTAALLLESDSGTLYVNRSGVLYPALNLTSALLAADPADTAGGRPRPTEVRAEDLGDAPRGALLGIPGAPGQLPGAADLLADRWSVCQPPELDPGASHAGDPGAAGVTVVIGLPTPGVPMSGRQALLVTAGPGADYLVWDGRRSRIDLSNRVIAEALRLSGARPREVGAGLLNAIPEAAPIVVPTVTGAGDPTRGFTVLDAGGRALPAGAVFTVARAGHSDSFHVLHPDGVQEITATVADLLRFRRAAAAGLPSVPPDVLAAAPVAQLELIDAGAVPPSVPEVIDPVSAPMVCAGWDGSAPGGARWVVTIGSGLPVGSPTVTLAGIDPQATAARVVIAPSHGALVREVVTGRPDQPAATVYLVTDLGVAFPVAGDGALGRLGFTAEVASAPAEALDLLPRGPVLDPAAATRLWATFPDVELPRPDPPAVLGDGVGDGVGDAPASMPAPAS